ncbi:hypothetical protein [Arthrobacter castelli]|uniref:hypothetical protein n=1 Tax=Arthrobacter castelli TaxID=271431 RepID=UPI0012DCF9AB|nr:hypothetical protein [Arthrobacter castelli]
MSKSASNLPPDASRDDGETGPGRPAGVVLIAAVVILEALALLAAAGFYLYGLATSTPASLGGAVFMLVLLLLLSAWLFVVGHFLWRGYSWTRAAILTWQLFMLVIAVPTLTGGYVLYGLCLLVPPVVAVVLLFQRRVVAFMSRTSQPPAAL